MKFSIQKSSKSKFFEVKIPPSVNVSHFSNREKFEVLIINNSENIKNIEVMILADGLSFLLQNQVVRIKNNFVKLKQNHFLLAIQNGNFVSQNHYYAELIKPVKAKVINIVNSNGDIVSPISGKVIALLVKKGDRVKEGDHLLIIEAMKMENRILSECDGTISEIKVVVGDSVSTGDFLIKVIPDTKES
jgi:biotin carboxyl carrier protein